MTYSPKPGDVVAVRRILDAIAVDDLSTSTREPDYIVAPRSSFPKSQIAPWTPPELLEAYEELYAALEDLENFEEEEWDVEHETYPEPTGEHTQNCPGCQPLIKVEQRLETARAKVREIKENWGGA